MIRDRRADQANPYDFKAYKVRNKIERCFNELKRMRYDLL